MIPLVMVDIGVLPSVHAQRLTAALGPAKDDNARGHWWPVNLHTMIHVYYMHPRLALCHFLQLSSNIARFAVSPRWAVAGILVA